MKTKQIDDAVRTANPARIDDLDARARADLAEILATPATEPVTGTMLTRRRVGLVAVAAVLTGAVAVGVPFVRGGDTMAYAATPPPLRYESMPGADAPALLRQLAARVAGRPDDTGPGRYAYVESKSWNLTAGESTRSVIEPTATRSWIAADGSGRLVIERAEGDRDDVVRGPGEHQLMWPLRSLSADDTTLARQLADGHPVANGPMERLVAIGDAYRQLPLPPAVRAAVLRYLADTPGLTVTGRTVDRLGRPGIGFSVESDNSGLPTRFTAVIDPDTGRLFGYEQTLTKDAGRLNVPIPSVVGYDVLVRSHYTDSTS